MGTPALSDAQVPPDHVCTLVGVVLPRMEYRGRVFRNVRAVRCSACGYEAVTPNILARLDAKVAERA